MFDFIVAIVVGFVGLFVVYTLFLSISVTEVAPAVASTKKDKKKDKKAASQDQQSKKAKKEEDAIIQAELSLARGGMDADKKKATATTLDDVKEARRKKAAAKESSSAAKQTAFSDKQILLEKEEGFQVIAPKVAERAAKTPSPTGGKQELSPKQQLDRKLGSFFKNNAKKGKRSYLGDDNNEGGTGGKAIVKKSIGAGDQNKWANADDRKF